MKKLSDCLCFEFKDLLALVPGAKSSQDVIRALIRKNVISRNKLGRLQVHTNYAGGDFTRSFRLGNNHWQLAFTQRGRDLIQDIFQGQGRIESFRKVAS